ARLAGLDPTNQLAALTDLIRSEAAVVLGHSSPEQITISGTFKDAGFDSLTAVELRNRLTAVIGVKFPATLVFDYPTLAGLAEYLRTRFLGVASGDARVPVRAVVGSVDPVVIVGMACRYPGGVSSPENLWDVVAAGVDAVSGFPTDRGW